jgi:anti-sigma B factor antagonist
VSDLVQVTIEASGDVAVARLRGEIDLSNAENVLERILEGAVNQPGPGLVVDLSQTRYIDSAGIRALFELAERLEALGKRVRVVVPEDASIRRVIELAGAQEVLDVDTTPAAALAALGAGGAG